jgi:hypothetical protein
MLCLTVIPHRMQRILAEGLSSPNDTTREQTIRCHPNENGSFRICTSGRSVVTVTPSHKTEVLLNF